MTSGTKTRNYAGYAGTGTYTDPAGSTSVSIECTSFQTTTSLGHGGPPRGGSRGDVGGPFNTTRYEYRGNHPTFGAGLGTFPSPHYAGPVFPDGVTEMHAPAGWPTITLNHSDSEMDALGTTAIARTTPTSPIASMANFIGELKRDGIPDIIGSQSFKQRGQVLRNAGDEYLNVEFGWKPFLGDLRSFGYVIKNHADLVRWIQKQSGKDIHVRYDFPSINTTTNNASGDAYACSIVGEGLPSGGARGKKKRTTQNTRETWFEGCYNFYLHPGDEPIDKMIRFEQYANMLLGTRITPEVVWNLAPWSWAVDWVSNVGDIFHNISALGADGLVLRYGYMMSHTKAVETTSVSDSMHRNSANDPKYYPVSCSRQLITERKVRRRATPYGFGLNTDAFTERQWAIIAALGLSKGGKRAL